MSVINTNVNAVLAQNALVKNERSMSTAMEQLSTGKRINSAADDAAGMAIASKMTSQIRGLDQAVRNINDAVSMIQTAEGATGEITNMLQRMRELAVQTASGTNTTDDQANIEAEFQALLTGIDDVADTTQWNGKNILDGSQAATSFQIGANGGQTMLVNLGNLQSDAFVAGTPGSSSVTQTDAEIAALVSITVGTTTVTGTALEAAADDASLAAALNADADFSAKYTAASTGNVLTVSENADTVSSGVALTITAANAAGDDFATVAGTATQAVTDLEISELTSVTVGSVTVNSAALLAATDEAGFVSALNADTDFSALYTATGDGAGTLTVTETAGNFSGAAITITGAVGAQPDLIAAEVPTAGSPGTSVITPTDAEIQALTSLTVGAVTVNSAGLQAATDAATLSTALNADAGFSAVYTASESSGELTITENAGSFSSALTIVGDSAAVSTTATQVFAANEIVNLQSMTVGSTTAVTSAALLAATDVTTLAAALNAETGSGNFAEKFTASVSGSDLLITENSGQESITPITVTKITEDDITAAESATAGVAGSTVQVVTDAEIVALESYTVGAVTVNSQLLTDATNEAEFVAALNADAGFSAVYTAVGDSALNVTITEKAGNITNAVIVESSVALAAVDFAATEAQTSGSTEAIQGTVTDAGFTNAEIADLTAVVAGGISVTVSGLTDIDSLTAAMNADATFAAAYVASSVGSGLVVTEVVGQETAADITMTYTNGGTDTHTPSLTQANGTVEVLAVDTLVTTDAEIAAAQSISFGETGTPGGIITVDSAALIAATNESTLVAALNADSGFSARYVASSTGANNLTLTEVAGQAQGAAGVTAITRTSNTTAGLATSGAATATAGVTGSVTQDITDAEIAAFESITIGGINVATAGVTSATNMAELTTALNADATFAAAYVATSTNNTLTVTEQAAAMTTDTIAVSGVIVSPDEAFTTGVAAGVTGVVSTDAFTSEVATVAVAGTVTQAMTDGEIDELSSLTVGGIAVNSAALLAATDMTTLVSALNAEPTTAGSFGEKYTASDVSGDLVITEKAGQFTNVDITVVGAGTAAADFAAAETAVVGSVSTSTVGSTGTLGFGADISGLTSTTADVIVILDAALNSVSTQRAEHGAAINRLEYTADNLSNVSMNTQASRSRIEDADYAKATTELARTQIIQQAGTAMLAQANQQSQGVLALLQ